MWREKRKKEKIKRVEGEKWRTLRLMLKEYTGKRKKRRKWQGKKEEREERRGERVRRETKCKTKAQKNREIKLN